MASRANNGKDPIDIPIITESEVELETDIKEILPPTCGECGRALIWSGRGRKPTKCRRGEGCQEKQDPVILGNRPTPKGEVERIQQGMLDLYVSVGAAVSIFDQFDGFTIGQHAGSLAESWAQLAEQDPKVRKALMRMLSGTSWAGVIAAHVAIAIPIMQHHHMIPQVVEETTTRDVI